MNLQAFGTEARVIAPAGSKVLQGIYDDDYYQHRFGQSSEVNGRYHSFLLFESDTEHITPGCGLELVRPNGVESFTVVRMENEAGGMVYVILTAGVDNDPD